MVLKEPPEILRFYKKRPCPELIRQAAQITQQMLQEAGALPAETKEEAE